MRAMNAKSRKWVRVCILFLCIWVTAGCADRGLYITEVLHWKLMQHMKRKYFKAKDTFTIGAGGFDGTKYVLTMDSKKYDRSYPGRQIYVYYDVDKQEIRDNYMAFVLHDEIEEAYRPIFDAVYGEENYYFQFNIHSFLFSDPDYDWNTAVSDYLSTISDSQFTVVCKKDPQSKEEDVGRVIQLVKEKGWGIDLIIYYVSEDVFAQVHDIQSSAYIYKEHELYRGSINFSRNHQEPAFELWSEGQGEKE